MLFACSEPSKFRYSADSAEPTFVDPSQCPSDDIECRMGLAQHPPTNASIVLAPSIIASQTPVFVTAAEALPGQLEVNGGQATYKLSLQLPIGVNGMVPSLELEYRNSRRNGIVGVGWEVSGFSTITRCPKTMGQDDVASPITDTNADRFCLDGQKLVAISGDYGADGTEYRTEFDSFARIFSRGTPDDQGRYLGPVSFEVWTPEGRVNQYGTGDGTTEMRSGVRRTWGLSQSRDRFNNTITYTYTQTVCDLPAGGAPALCYGTGLVPNEIFYGSHLGGNAPDISVAADRSIRFIYSTDREDRNTSYERGLPRVMRQRLDGIEMIVNGQTVWAYKLRYEYVGLNRLAGVQRCAPTNPLLWTCTGETTFTYATNGQSIKRTPAPSAKVSWVFGNGYMSRGYGRTLHLDWNGDGRDDIFTPVSPRSANYELLIAQASGEPFAPPMHLPIDAEFDFGNLPIPECYSQEGVVDFNRDGRDDILDLCWNRRYGGYHVWISTPAGFENQVLSFLPGEGPPTGYVSNTLHVADFDGDGWFDLLTCDGPENSRHLSLYRNKGDTQGFENRRAMPDLGRDCDYAPTLLIDFDGDGVVNLVRAESVPYQELYQTTGYDLKPRWRALVITPTMAQWVPLPMFSTPPLWPNPFAPIDEEASYNWEYFGNPYGNNLTLNVTTVAPLWQFKVLDYNGDGLSDFLVFEGDQPTAPERIALYVNKGAGFLRVPVALGTMHEIDNYAFYRMTVIDWDGDGRQDLVIPVGPVGHPHDPPTRMVLFRSVGKDGPFEPKVLGGTIYRGSVPVAADIDGDGDTDLVMPETDTRISVIYATTNVEHMLTSVTNGLGERHQIHYAQSPNDPDAAYSMSAGCGLTTQCMRRAAPLVRKTEQMVTRRSWGGTSPVQVKRSTYSYKDALVGLYGRGALGFREITRVDADPTGHEATTTTTTYDNDFLWQTFAGTTTKHWYPYAGWPSKIVMTHGNLTDFADQPTERVQVVENMLGVQLSPEGRPFTVVRHSAQTVSEGMQSRSLIARSETNRTYDGYGNVLNETVDLRNASFAVTETQSTTSTFRTDPAGVADWLVRCEGTRTETSTVGGETQTRTTDEKCIAPGVPARLTREPTSSDPALFLSVDFHYDRFGNQVGTVATDLTGATRVTSREYDARGLTVTRTTAGGLLSTIYSVDPVHGGTRSETAPNGITTTTDYDALSRPSRITTPDGTTTFAYETPPAGTLDPAVSDVGMMMIRRTDPGAEQTEVVLDGLGREVQTRTTGYFGTIVTQERSYDYAGRVISETAPHIVDDISQGGTTYEYDALGRLRFERHTDESASGGVAVTQRRYGSLTLGNLWDAATQARVISVVQEIAPSGATELKGLDHHGAVVVAHDANGGMTTYRAGAFGLLTQVGDHMGNVTRIKYDLAGRRTTLVEPNIGTQSTTFDAFGEVRTSTDASGLVTSLGYDDIGRLIQRVDGTGEVATFVYDGTGTRQGQLVEATTQSSSNGPITTRIAYDYWPLGAPGAGLAKSMSRTVGGKKFEMRMDYDHNGRLSLLHYPLVDGGNPFDVLHTYDAFGHLVSVADAASGRPYWTVSAADQGHRIGVDQLGDGTQTRWSYQPRAGRLVGIETRTLNSPSTVLQSLSYGYNDREEIETRTDSLDPLRSRRYEHDLGGRLTRVVQQHGSGPAVELERFAYDEIGNITSRSTVGNYIYGSTKPHAVTSAGANAYTYDARGNQTLRLGPSIPGGRQQIDYTAFNLPSRITTGSGDALSTTDFTYDAADMRAYTSTSAGKQTWYVGAHYEMEQGAASVSHRYRVYGPSRVVAEVVRKQGGPGQPLERPATSYLHPDAQGSTDLITNAAGAVVTRPMFEPFGNLSGSGGGVVTGFTGHRQEELGLIDMGGRFYDPTLAAFSRRIQSSATRSRPRA